MPNVNNTFRYSLTTRLGTIITEPIGESDFQIEWNRKEDTNIDYQQLLPSKITFTAEVGTAYQMLLKLEKSDYRCEYNYLSVERPCTTTGTLVWLPWFSGRFSLNDGSWFEDRCEVELKLDEQQPGDCYEANKETERDFFALVQSRQTVYLDDPAISLETVSYSEDRQSSPFPSTELWQGAGDPYAQRWGVVYKKNTKIDFYAGSFNTATYYYREIKWVREVLVLPCGSPSPVAEWLLIQDTCPGGSRKYVRFPRTYGCLEGTVVGEKVNGARPTTYTKTCQYIGNGELASIDNGMKLSEMIVNAFADTCPTLTVVSDFLQINPDIVSDLNYVTLLPSKTTNIIAFQKSDVKRPNVSGNAGRAVGKLKEIIEGLCELYNCRTAVQNGIFRIEHVSYYGKAKGLDLTQSKYEKHVLETKRYTYQTAQIPQSENYKMMESSVGDFAGLPIVYSGACVTSNSKNNSPTHAVENITTDVQLVIANPESDSNVVSDKGFVFIACDANNRVITESSILGGAILNNSMAWAQLHRDYHRYDRPLKRGTMNGQATNFLSIKPTRKGPQLAIPLCCDDYFNPDNTIQTVLGAGTVEKGAFSFKDEILTVDLLYDAETGLIENHPPVAVGDVAYAFQNTSVDITVLFNDTDPDPGFTITGVEIFLPPMNGTAVVLPNLQIRYTPNNGFIGQDQLLYKIKDEWNEPSNAALIAIGVYDPNTPPTANDDSYTVKQNTPLTIASPGVFNNDIGPGAVTLVSFTQPANGTIQISATGGFTYTPNAGFNGQDSATYTIRNAAGFTDTATINFNVLNAVNPIAVDDTYYVSQNGTLLIYPTGVLGNDVTQQGTLTVSPGNINLTSAQGGNVTLYDDGSFSYNPPMDFIGIDTFPYTVSNGTGTDNGLVTIIVNQNVYVRLDKMQQQGGVIYDGNCNNPSVPSGNYEEAKYRLSFFADAAATIPLDVTPYNLTGNYRVSGMLSNYTPYANDYQVPLKGTFVDLFGSGFYRYYSYSTFCFGGTDTVNSATYKNEVISLQSGNYIII